jgi:hypothetical protein
MEWLMVGPPISKVPVPFMLLTVYSSLTMQLVVEAVFEVMLLVLRLNSTIQISQTTVRTTEEVCLLMEIHFFRIALWK